MGGFPAAHIGSTTMHGGTVTVGMPTVMIGGTPASRIGDMHLCPMVTPGTPPIPHVGGPFVLGAFNVLVGGVPQSRVTDMLVCVGPPDTCAMGAPTVLVGMVGAMGLFGLVMSGLLAGLHNFLGGYPKAVLQPDGTTVTEYNSQITIQGSPEYQAAVIADLNKFLATRTGQNWAAAYAQTGHKITIRPMQPGEDAANGYTTPTDQAAAHRTAAGPGTGSDSIISYNPTFNMNYKAADGTTQTNSPDQTLGHEMIHSLHNANGDNRQYNTQPYPYDNEEESQTIGVNGHDNDPITERQMKVDSGEPYRPDHGATTATYQDSSGNWKQRDFSTGKDTPLAGPPAGFSGRPFN